MLVGLTWTHATCAHSLSDLQQVKASQAFIAALAVISLDSNEISCSEHQSKLSTHACVRGVCMDAAYQPL